MIRIDSIHPTAEERRTFDPESVTEFCFRDVPVGILTLTGADVLDFIQRMTTNDVRKLLEGSGATTVFTNEKGRIIDAVDLYHAGGGRILAIHSAGTEHALEEVFKKYVILEDVVVRRDHVCILERSGNSAGKTVTTAGDGAISLNAPRILPEGRLIAATEEKLAEYTSGSTRQPVEKWVYNSIRIEKGIPLYGFDFDDGVNPLEANLQDFISWTKGCYVGQEVIARLDTYRKIKRVLKGVVLDSVLSDRDLGLTGETYIDLHQVNGGKIGTVTSAGYSYTMKTSVLLARIEREAAQRGSRIACTIGEREYNGIISDLPFSDVAHE
jgi:tRNA-modifying protein YgfZ